MSNKDREEPKVKNETHWLSEEDDDEDIKTERTKIKKDITGSMKNGRQKEQIEDNPPMGSMADKIDLENAQTPIRDCKNKTESTGDRMSAENQENLNSKEKGGRSKGGLR